MDMPLDLSSNESDLQQENNTPELNLPSYLVATDTHSIANNNWSFGESAAYGTVGVLTSALTQTWNILPTLGNLLGGDFEQVKTAEVLQSLDDDLGKYYVQHEQGIDAAGFLLSSIVPGTAGIKIGRMGFNVLRGAAEAGTFGRGIAGATGILAPKQVKLLAEATELALKPNAGFPIFNSATVKSLAAGAGQAALEGAAYETAVAATMYNSPTLKDQDFGDIVSNVIHGAVGFGILGGAIHGAGTYFKIKNAGKVLDKELWDFNTISELAPSARASDHIMNYFEQLKTLPDIEAARIAGNWTGESAWKFDKAASMLEGKQNYLKTKIRDSLGTLAKNDQALADTLYTEYGKLDLAGAEAKIFASEEVARLGTRTAFETTESSVLKKFGQTLNLETLKEMPNKSLVYLKLAGEDAGRVVSQAPTLLNIADKIKPGTNYASAVEGYGQRLGKTESWNHLDTDAFVSEARYVTALKHEFTDADVVHITDIPYLQAAYVKGVEKLTVAEGGFDKALNKGGRIEQEISRQELGELLQSTKLSAKNDMLLKGHDPEYIAKVLDIKRELVEDTIKGDPLKSLIVTTSPEQFASPQWAKVVKDLTPVKDTNGNIVEGMLALKERQVQYEDGVDRVVANVLGEESARIFRIQDSHITRANRFGPGNGMLTAQNESYGSLGSITQVLGASTLKIIGRAQDATREVFTPLLQKLQLKPQAAIEWSVLNANLRQYGEGFTYSAEHGGMIPTKLYRYEQAVAAGEDVVMPILPEGLPEFIAIKNPEVAELVQAHITTNADRLGKLGAIRSQQGVQFKRDAASFYPIPANPKDYPFFAHVVDDTVGGYGHSKMLFAGSRADLEAQITAVKAADPTLRVLTKADAEGWYKAIGQYEFERTLTDTAFNPAVARAGKSANYLPPTDPQKIVSDALNWHLQRDASLVREAVLLKNEAQVATLRQLGESYASVKGSHFTSLDPVSYLEMQGANPYADYVKTMLGLSTSKEFPFWTPMNDLLDRKFSQIFSSVRKGVASAKSPEELASINSALQESGYKGAAYDAMTAALANSTAPRGILTSFVAKANSILSSAMLGWDPINAVNNVVGSTVLRTTELKSLIGAIEKADPSRAGELTELTKIAVPGTGKSVFSPAKMIARAMKDFHSAEGDLLATELKARGLMSTMREQSNYVMGQMSITGKESVAELNGVINKSFAAAKKFLANGDVYTGNKLAEDFNRFTSAHVVKQITDRAVAAGVIGPDEAWAYINTFVNRVEGNYIAAQRPGVFQGPLGQAMGLFQTYQFNLLQQLFRHVGEGPAKDTILMAGLQGTIYGLKGMPAFDAINTHLLGNASGNTAHRDMYTAVYGAAGKEAGDWLMYGVASNALGLISPDLKLNLYSRGDINPRNITVLPTNPANFPFIQASGKLFGSMIETAQKIGAGGDPVGAVLQGIEHAGVNRPLAGLAQTFEAINNPYARSYSTSNKGNVVASNDFLSLANMVRIAGAKPLNEAIALDKMYNIEAYAAADSDRRRMLGETIKTTVIAGKQPTQEQIDSFAAQYAATGGKQQQFAQFMMQQYRAANTSQVNTMVKQLQSPTARAMQEVMGGYGLKDFVNSTER